MTRTEANQLARLVIASVEEAWGRADDPRSGFFCQSIGVQGALVDSAILTFVMGQVSAEFAPAQRFVRDIAMALERTKAPGSGE